MSELQKRWFFSFAIGLALCIVCLAYIPQWQNYAPRVGDSIPKPPYLTPWTVIFVALLFYDYRVRWRMRVFQIGSLAALILPSLAAVGYIAQFFLAAETPAWLKSGLSIPAVILYFTLGSGFLGLSYRSNESHLPVAR